MDLYDIDPLITAHVEIAYLEAAHADPSVAEAVQTFTALPEGGEHR